MTKENLIYIYIGCPGHYYRKIIFYLTDIILLIPQNAHGHLRLCS